MILLPPSSPRRNPIDRPQRSKVAFRSRTNQTLEIDAKRCRRTSRGKTTPTELPIFTDLQLLAKRSSYIRYNAPP
jgi:hypothetical protein